MEKEKVDLLLKEYRDEIDNIDNYILKLLRKRLQNVDIIGQIKKENNIPALQEGRWNELLNRLKKDGENYGINLLFIEKVWNLIHEESLKIEK